MKEKESQVRSNLTLLANTSLLVLIGVFLSKILSYIYRILIARYFDPSVYGNFSLTLVIIGWFTTISTLGLHDGLLRFISYYRGKNNLNYIRFLVRFVFTITAFTSIISAILLFTLADPISTTFFHNSELAVLLRIFSITVPILVLSYPFLITIRSFEKIGWYSFIYNIAQNAIKVFVFVVLIFLALGQKAIGLSYIAGVLTLLVGSYIVCRHYFPGILAKQLLKKKEKSYLKKEIFSYSLPLLLFGIVSIIFYWIDSLSLGYYKSSFEVGLYNAAVPIAALLGIIPELFMQLFFPLVTKEYSRKNVPLIKELSKQIGKWVFLLNLPAFVLIFIFPGAVINLLFGSQYLGAESALRLLSLSALISSVFLISSNLITMTGKSRLILINILVAAVVNVVLNIVLIPSSSIFGLDNSSGLVGASIATLLSVVLLNALFVIQAYRQTGIIPIRRKMIRVLLCVLVSTGVLLWVKKYLTINLISIIMLSILFFLVYLILIFLTKSLDRNDLFIMKGLLSKFKGISKLIKFPHFSRSYDS